MHAVSAAHRMEKWMTPKCYLYCIRAHTHIISDFFFHFSIWAQPSVPCMNITGKIHENRYKNEKFSTVSQSMLMSVYVFVRLCAFVQSSPNWLYVPCVCAAFPNKSMENVYRSLSFLQMHFIWSHISTCIPCALPRSECSCWSILNK